MARELLTDPPELKQHAARGDPPMVKWPGRPLGETDIIRASGVSRDWFRYRHRESSAVTAWAEFADGQARRKDLTVGFDWNQILILGDYGSGKTMLGVFAARDMFGRGHPVFANASVLFGWRLTPVEIYTAMAFTPKGSVIIIDESSAALSSRLGHSVAVTTMSEINLNIRKQASVVFYVSAQDWMIAPSIRRDCKEVWMPVSKDAPEVTDDQDMAPGPKDPANDYRNFRLARHVWDDFPYKEGNLIEGSDNAEGFDPPSYTMYAEGEEVRRALLLNDTFELAQSGAATIAETPSSYSALATEEKPTSSPMTFRSG